MAHCPITQHTGEALERFRETGRLPLGHWPTPLQEMPRLRAELGCAPRLWIKHDDWSGPGFGGNKVRKLEYYLGKAAAQGYDTVITCGGVRSNHCRVTAALAAQAGFECHLVLNGAGSGNEASYWTSELCGARIVRVREREERAPAMNEIASRLRAQGRRPMVIPLGASTALGALGFVRAAEELSMQCAAAGFRPEWIVHSTSSGGTQAGLLAGLRLQGLENVGVMGISADDPSASIGETVQTIVAEIELKLAAPACSLQAPIHVDDRFVGGGYGIPTPESEAALGLLARTEGVVLDPVYSAKAMAGMLRLIDQPPLSAAGNVIFWHTGGALALFHREG